MKRTVLLDGDIVAYKAAFVAEEAHQFTDDTWVSSANMEKAQEHVRNLIASIREHVGRCDIVLTFSDTENFRKELLPSYKAPRGKVRKPMLLKPLKEWMATRAPTYIRSRLEADDVLGILATATVKGIEGEKIIASIDKDLLQIPGLHFNFDKPSAGVTSVSADEGDYRHLMQTLTGDTVDNYSGCPGIGPKKAEAVLFGVSPPWGTSPEAWSAIIAAYKQKGLTEDDALLQARVARILRASDYDFPTKSVRLWTPPSP